MQAATPFARRGLLAAAVALLVGHALVFNFINDDAFISFRYADNLVRHGQLVFNVGERVEGYTNFLWTMLMAGVLALGRDPVFWSKALGVLCSALTLLVVARFLARRAEASRWDLIAPLLLAGSPAFACWSTGGLETALFTLLTTLGWTQYLLERQGAAPRHPVSGLWMALAAMTRPEGMLFFGLTGLHRLIELLWTQRGRLRPPKVDWLWGLGFGLPFGAYFAWRWWYYGWPLPNTYYVKSGAQSFWGPGLRYLGSWLQSHPWLWAAPLLAGLRLRGAGGTRLQTLVGLYTLGLSLHVARVGGDFMALHRFVVPLMPGLAVLVALGARRALSEAAAEAPRRLAVAGLLTACLMGGHAASVDAEALRVDSRAGVDSIGWLSMFAEQCGIMGRWLGAHSQPGESLATTAAGIIPFYSRLYTVDLLGLNDEWVAHNVPARGNRPGHTKVAPAAYVEEKKVTYYIGHPDPRLRRRGGGRRRGFHWQVQQIPGLRVDPRRVRRPQERQVDAWWGFHRRD